MFHVHLPEKGSHDQLSALHGLYTIPTDFNGCLNSSFLPEATIHRSHWGLLPGLHPPRPQQHQLKTLCPLFISSTCDCPFYSTSDTYEKVLSVLPYVEFLFFFFLCVCVCGEASLLHCHKCNHLLSLKHIILYTNIDLG